MQEDPTNLEQLLDRLCAARGDDHHVTVGSIIAHIGTRSFGPLLLLAGVILASPLSGIPGMPTTMGVLVLLISLQLLLHRKHFWLPGWMLRRSVSRHKVERAVAWMQPPARFVDRFLRPRLHVLVGRRAVYLVATICALIALMVPLLEVVPFSASAAGVALSIFALALIARDGLMALIAYAITGGVVALLVWNLL